MSQGIAREENLTWIYFLKIKKKKVINLTKYVSYFNTVSNVFFLVHFQAVMVKKLRYKYYNKRITTQ